MEKEIKKYQLDILKNMRYFVDKFEIKHHYDGGIVYNMNVNDTHIAIFIDIERKLVSMQFFMNKFIAIKKEFMDLNNVHSIIVNEICSRV